MVSSVARRVVTVLALAGAVAACGPATPPEIAADADLVADGTLTACVAPTPRLVVPTDDGGFEGYDVEALQAVAGDLELGLELVEATFDDLVSGVAVNDRRCDIAAAGIVAGGDLDVLVEVTVPYREVDRLVVAAEGAGAAATLRVGVEADGPAADALDALEAGEVREVPSLGDLLRFLVAGDLDAVLVPADQVPAVAEAVGPVTVVERVPTGDSTVMLLRRGMDEAFLEVVDEALTAFADGPAGAAATERWLGG
jgi:polar amino acid transport system substrate-binding protein